MSIKDLLPLGNYRIGTSIMTEYIGADSSSSSWVRVTFVEPNKKCLFCTRYYNYDHSIESSRNHEVAMWTFVIENIDDKRLSTAIGNERKPFSVFRSEAEDGFVWTLVSGSESRYDKVASEVVLSMVKKNSV